MWWRQAILKEKKSLLPVDARCSKTLLLKLLNTLGHIWINFYACSHFEVFLPWIKTRFLQWLIFQRFSLIIIIVSKFYFAPVDIFPGHCNNLLLSRMPGDLTLLSMQILYLPLKRRRFSTVSVLYFCCQGLPWNYSFYRKSSIKHPPLSGGKS